MDEKESQKDKSKDKKESKDDVILALEADLAEKTDLLQRVQADFENYIKRTEKDTSNHAKKAQMDFAKDLLSIMDAIEAGILQEKDKESNAFKGLLLLFEEMRKLFHKRNIREIPSINNPLDPAVHDVLLTRDEGEENSGIVVEVLQKGYMFENHVLRHAKVIVGK
jgi:molecular chaperone GrpE